MADVPTIADYIFRRATELGVDPNMALGIASREGLNPRTIGSPTFGNADTRGYSFGPFQLFSGSRDPRRIAPGGMAYEFQQRFSAPPSAENWREQVDFSLERMRDRGVRPWYAVRDAGGVGPITEIGRQFASRFGLGGAPAAPAGVPGPEADVGSFAVPPPQPQPVVSLPAPVPAPAPAAAAPVYGNDIGTGLRRLGNYLAPSLVDPATPLTPEQAQAQQDQQREQAQRMASVGAAQRGFLGLSQLGAPQQMEQPQMRAQVVPPRPFEPIGIRRRRGLLD
jgi:hypothetical protein